MWLQASFGYCLFGDDMTILGEVVRDVFISGQSQVISLGLCILSVGPSANSTIRMLFQHIRMLCMNLIRCEQNKMSPSSDCKRHVNPHRPVSCESLDDAKICDKSLPLHNTFCAADLCSVRTWALCNRPWWLKHMIKSLYMVQENTSLFNGEVRIHTFILHFRMTVVCVMAIIDQLSIPENVYTKPMNMPAVFSSRSWRCMVRSDL